ncbi:MAG: lysophospholipid acyltransferase family protein [Desulfatiglandales bacterium]
MKSVKLSAFLQWKVNIFLYLTLGWKVTRLLVFALGRTYFFFKKEEKRRIIDAVSEVASGRNRRNARKIKKGVFDGILCHYYEKMFIAFEKPEKAADFLKNSIRIDDLDVLRRELSKGNGVIMVTGHYGAIEYIPTLLAVNSLPVTMIARFNSKQLKERAFSQAEKYGIRLIDAAQSGGVIASAVSELRNNRIVVTECDEIEEWRPSKIEKISFLGKVTGLDRTINVIYKRTKAEVVFGVIHRYSLNSYKLIAVSRDEMAQRMKNGGFSSVGETVLKFLEHHIYQNPEQWYQWKNYGEIGWVPSYIPGGNPPERPALLKPQWAPGS